MRKTAYAIKFSARACAVALFTFAIAGIALASGDWAGRYESPHGIGLELEAIGGGSFEGRLTIDAGDRQQTFPVAMRGSSERLSGSLQVGNDSFALEITPGEEPRQIVLVSDGAMYELEKQGGAKIEGAQKASANPLLQAGTAIAESTSPRGTATSSNGRNVIFNGQRLDDATLARLEGSTPVIPDGNYWYDNRSGMAGSVGGPTEAYLEPGLNLGGALSPQASGGATAVALNGRYLHPIDLAGLEYYFGQIPPGRFWMDGSGDYGREGGPKEGNILEDIAFIEMYAAEVQAQMMQQSQAYGNGSYNGQGGGYYDQSGNGGGSVYSHFPNLGASGTGVSVADFGNGDGIVNAGGVLWWPGK